MMQIRRVMSPEAGAVRARVVTLLAFAAAFAIALVAGWGDLWSVPGYISLLVVAVLARLWGFRAAMFGAATLGILLWFRILPFAFPDRPMPFRLLRLSLFLVVSIIIAFIVLQKDEVEERYQRLVELSPDGIGMVDEHGRITFANPAMLRILGATSPKDVIGKRPVEFIHPDDCARAEERIGRLLEGERIEWIEERWVRLDGRIINVEVGAVPSRQHGETVGQGFVRDITQRKEAEAREAESRRRFEALFDATMDAILFIDSNRRYAGANAAASVLLGYTHEEILSKSLGDFTPPGAMEKTESIWRNAVAGRNTRCESVIACKDGRILEVELQVMADVLPGVHAAFLHDITARKAAERSVQQLSARLLQLQDEERRRIARELHDATAQNLAAVRMNLARMARFAEAEPQLREALQESLALTDESISEVRTLSYLLHPPMIEEAGLVPALRWYAQGFQERSGIAVKLELPPQLERLPAELERSVFRIVQEALSNIQRHSESPVATIRLERDGGLLRLRIEDQGRGMPPHLRDSRDLLGATGVGIAGMRERARELGGSMAIESRADGTSVVVTLPVAGETTPI